MNVILHFRNNTENRKELWHENNQEEKLAQKTADMRKKLFIITNNN